MKTTKFRIAIVFLAASMIVLSACSGKNANAANYEDSSAHEEALINDDEAVTAITDYDAGTVITETVAPGSTENAETNDPNGTAEDIETEDSSGTAAPNEASGSSDASVNNVSNDATNTGNSALSTGNNSTVSTETGTKVTLNGSSVNVSGSGVSISGSVVTITAGGSYTISGSLSDGRIIVNAPKADVSITLNGVSITCSYGSPIYVYKSSLTTINLASGTANILTDGSSYTFSDSYSSSADEEPDACLYSKSDLVISGSGTLTINANYKNGITGKDTLLISDATLSVTAKNNGINGKDSNIITNANITVNSGGDAIRSTNDTDSSLGYITISGSTLNLTAGEDGIQAETNLTISGGTFNIKAGGGSAAKISSTASAKGLKAGAIITISGGKFTIDSADDGIHSNGDISIGNGTFTISTGDDAVHADKELNVKGGDINITKSYEGLEGSTVNISGGTVSIVSSDDGINAAGGDGSGTGGPFGNDRFASSGSYAINISGGSITINANGDGIDSNGNITMTGGTVFVSGPTSNSDGAIDCDGTFNLSGGTIIAAGSSGMAEAPGASSSQPSLHVYYTSTQSAGTVIDLKSSDGKTIASFTPAKNYQSVVISTPDMKLNETYSLYSGGTKLCDVALSSSVTSVNDSGSAVAGGGVGGPGGNKGGRR